MKRSKINASQDTVAVSAVSISQVPNHIVGDILSRLPLNSIFTCKRVCKTWRDLTLEPYFARLRLSRFPLSLIIYRNGIDKHSPSHFEILELHDPPFSGHHNATAKFETDIDFPRKRFDIVASCNGLVLLSDDPSNDLAIVCNPLTAYRFILPEPPNLADLVGFGFVHSPAIDQYKVLRFTHKFGTARLYCDIFTIRSGGEWRRIVDTGQPPVQLIGFVFLNSAVHWIGFENSRLICYFDIEKEQFGSFPLPSHFGKGCISLGVVDNRLYIHLNHPFGVTKFWAMKFYGDFSSWTLEWVIDESVIDKFDGYLKPLKVLKDGTLLMMHSKCHWTSSHNRITRQDKITQMSRTLASYNPQTRLLKMIEYPDVEFLRYGEGEEIIKSCSILVQLQGAKVGILV